MKRNIIVIICWNILFSRCLELQIKETIVGNGWANNSVNTVILRYSALTIFNGYQFTDYYDNVCNVVLAKRKLGEAIWLRFSTPYKGNARDAHNDISIAIDSPCPIDWTKNNKQVK